MISGDKVEFMGWNWALIFPEFQQREASLPVSFPPSALPHLLNHPKEIGEIKAILIIMEKIMSVGQKFMYFNSLCAVG
jgi:hypothetical protein